MSEDRQQKESHAVQRTRPRGIDPKTGKPYEGIEIPVPTRGAWEDVLQKATRPTSKDDRQPDRP
jgi:hypothetical protein